jgi:hypothetical protein
MSQKTPFKDKFDFIEAKCWGVNEKIYFRIQIRNLDEDLIEMLTILIRVFFAAKLGNHIQDVCAIALWKIIHRHLVDEGLRFWLGLHTDNTTKSRLKSYS